MGEQLIEKLAFIMKDKALPKETLREILELGRDKMGGFSLDKICDESDRFFDKKCADEFNAHPDAQCKSEKFENTIHNYVYSFESYYYTSDGNIHPKNCKSKFHDCFLKHPNANIVIWPDKRLIDGFDFPITKDVNYYDSIAKKYPQIQLFAESEKDFAARYKEFGIRYSTLLRAPVNKCKCCSGVKFANLPAIHFASIIHSHANDNRYNSLDFKSLSLIGKPLPIVNGY